MSGHHCLGPPGPDQALGDLGAGAVEAEERPAGDLEEELRAIFEVRPPEAVEDLHRQPDRVVLRSEHDGRHGAHEDSSRDARAAVSTQVMRRFTATGRMTDHGNRPKVERLKELGHVIGILIHVVPIPGLTGTSVSTPIVGDAAKPL